jgi:hypothetical protein
MHGRRLIFTTTREKENPPCGGLPFCELDATKLAHDGYASFWTLTIEFDFITARAD